MQRDPRASVVAVTARLPNDKLQTDLEALTSGWQAAGMQATAMRASWMSRPKVKFVFDGAHRNHR